MNKWVNGVIVEMTPEEEQEFNEEMTIKKEEEPAENDLISFITDLSKATTLAQMRNAAKKFLDGTEG